jgi:hypothetical protein
LIGKPKTTTGEVSLDAFFDVSSAPVACEGTTRSPQAATAVLLQFAQIFFVYFPRLCVDDEAIL